MRLVGRERRAERLALLERLRQVLLLVVGEMRGCCDLVRREHAPRRAVRRAEQPDCRSTVLVLAQFDRRVVRRHVDAGGLRAGEHVEEVLLLVVGEVRGRDDLRGSKGRRMRRASRRARRAAAPRRVRERELRFGGWREAARGQGKRRAAAARKHRAGGGRIDEVARGRLAAGGAAPEKRARACGRAGERPALRRLLPDL
mmetsp:Transcript_14450/g.45135  ORF Transcript_14450/g.45135 Transcript_14450/m.45135 type:complete len:200 (-) Transcript_14450:14-613(-)